MGGYSIKFEGLEELQLALLKKKNLAAVKTVVRQNGAELQTKAMRNAEFDKGYQTGTTKRSIGLELSDGDLTATVSPGTHYSPYLEYGTRFMEAQPFMGPAFNAQKRIFLADLKKLMK